MKKWFLFFFVLSGIFPGFAEAAQADTKPQKKFEASSLWGVRRGPNAPSPVPEEKSEAEKTREKNLKTAYEKQYEAQAKQAYLNSFSKPASAPVSAEECARKK